MKVANRLRLLVAANAGLGDAVAVLGELGYHSLSDRVAADQP